MRGVLDDVYIAKMVNRERHGHTTLAVAPSMGHAPSLRCTPRAASMVSGLTFSHRQWLWLPSLSLWGGLPPQWKKTSVWGESAVGYRRYRTKAQGRLVAITLDMAKGLSSPAMCPPRVTHPQASASWPVNRGKEGGACLTQGC